MHFLLSYHPFQRVGDQSFQLKRRYRIVFLGLGGIATCIAIIVFLIATGYWSSQYILYCGLCLIWCACLTWTFKNPRVYLLDGEKATCSYKVGRKSVVVNYHNVYIRLRRSGGQTSRKAQYQLIFNGQQLERQTITMRATPNLSNLRRLGQQIAENLNINYFDELNMSRHHIVRHTRRADVLDTLEEGRDEA